MMMMIIIIIMIMIMIPIRILDSLETTENRCLGIGRNKTL